MPPGMRIVCIGGGPAGLYFALLMKKADPAHRITVHERNGPDDTFGFGVVFSDATLGKLGEADAKRKRIKSSGFQVLEGGKKKPERDSDPGGPGRGPNGGWLN